MDLLLNLLLFLLDISYSQLSVQGVKSNFWKTDLRWTSSQAPPGVASTRCTELGQSSTYQNGTGKWDLLCGQAFDSEKILQITYTDTFIECLNACLDFDQSAPCLGVQYGPGNGTIDETEANICYLMWNMTNLTTSTRDNWDSARLQVSSLPQEDVCQNATTIPYTSPAGANFTFICGNDFEFNDIHLTFAVDLQDCANACERWNTVNSSAVRCMGSTLDLGVYGPSGEEGGSECFLKSSISGPGNPYQHKGPPKEVHSAKLLSNPGKQQTPQICTSKPSGGGIAGSVLGALIGAALFALAGFFFGKRYAETQRNKRAAQVTPPVTGR